MVTAAYISRSHFYSVFVLILAECLRFIIVHIRWVVFVFFLFCSVFYEEPRFDCMFLFEDSLLWKPAAALSLCFLIEICEGSWLNIHTKPLCSRYVAVLAGFLASVLFSFLSPLRCAVQPSAAVSLAEFLSLLSLPCLLPPLPSPPFPSLAFSWG